MFELEKFVCNSHQRPRQGEKVGGGEGFWQENESCDKKIQKRGSKSQFFLHQDEEPCCILPGNDFNQLGEQAGHLRQVSGLTASPILEPCFERSQRHHKLEGGCCTEKKNMIIWRKKLVLMKQGQGNTAYDKERVIIETA